MEIDRLALQVPSPPTEWVAGPGFGTDFTALMQSARTRSQQSRLSESEAAYRAAASFARQRDREPEAQIAEAAVQQLNRQLIQATETLQRVLEMPELRLRGMAFFFLGSVQRGCRRYREAISSYNEALHDETTFVWHSWALNNLGEVHELLASEDADDREGHSHDALRYYTRALSARDGTPNRYIEKYNCGRIHLKLGQRVGAVRWLRRALREVLALRPPDSQFCGLIRRDLGTAYFMIAANGRGRPGKPDTAGRDSLDPVLLRTRTIPYWVAAANDLDPRHPRHRDGGEGQKRDKAAVVQAKITILKNLLDEQQRPPSERHILPGSNDYRLLEWIPPSEVQIDGFSSPEERIFTKIVSARQDVYQQYASPRHPRADAERVDRPRCDQGYDSVLAILRGWSSAVPLVEKKESNCRGGGYFLKWRGKGLAIDPGYDFLRNFQDAGFHLREINGVIVSHNHPDHNFDLDAFDDLRYELYRRARNDLERGDWRYALVLDEDTERKFRDRFIYSSWPSHIRPVIRFELYRYMEYIRDRALERMDLGKVTIDLQKEAGLPFRIRYFKAKHSSDVANAVGFRVECLAKDAPNKVAVSVGFTCDTRFFPELCNAGHLGGCQILIPHISQPELWELVSREEVKKDAHLGYRGVESLLKGFEEQEPGGRPDLTLIGEFWAGLADLRVDIVQGLRQACMDERILPTSVGLLVEPRTRRIRCSHCGDWVPPGKVTVASTTEKFGPLAYLCSLCCIGPRP